MAQSLPTELLQWLFRVLQPEYVDPRTTYRDAAVTLQAYPTLKPRTRVYTSESGESQLLLNMYGSLPANIQGRVYKIPVELWIPQEYPLVAPIVFVVPTEKMVLRPGNHVDTSGRCYLPYISSWGQEDQPPNILSLCGALSGVFSRESPVFAKPLKPSRTISTPMSSLQAQSTGTPPPALPPKSQSQTPSIQSPIPALPPKQHSNETTSTGAASPPPLPPLPEELRSRMIQSPTLNRMNEQSQLRINAKPAFEQPNIMDGLTDAMSSTSATMTDRERESAIERVQSMLQNIYESDVSKSLSKFSADINQIKYAVGQFDKIFDYEFREIDRLNKQAIENEHAINIAIQASQETIDKANSFKEINTDEVICGETVVFNQLYDLVAEDQAISDTIYALTKAHDHGLIPLTSFIKHARNLARDQFMKKALVVKIASHLGLQQ